MSNTQKVPTVRDFTNVVANTYRIWKLDCHQGKQDKFNGLVSRMATMFPPDIPCDFNDQTGLHILADPETPLPKNTIQVFQQIVEESRLSKTPVLRLK